MTECQQSLSEYAIGYLVGLSISSNTCTLNATDEILKRNLKVDILGVGILGVDILGIDILGVDILGVDIVGVDILRLTSGHLSRYKIYHKIAK